MFPCSLHIVKVFSMNVEPTIFRSPRAPRAETLRTLVAIAIPAFLSMAFATCAHAQVIRGANFPSKIVAWITCTESDTQGNEKVLFDKKIKIPACKYDDTYVTYSPFHFDEGNRCSGARRGVVANLRRGRQAHMMFDLAYNPTLKEFQFTTLDFTFSGGHSPSDPAFISVIGNGLRIVPDAEIKLQAMYQLHDPFVDTGAMNTSETGNLSCSVVLQS